MNILPLLITFACAWISGYFFGRATELHKQIEHERSSKP